MPTSGGTETVRRVAVAPIPRVARGAALVCGALGAAGLLGWALDIPPLLRLLPGLPEMQPNTGLALVACGLAVALPLRARPAAVLLALFAVVLGVLTTVEYLAGIDLGVDDLVLRGSGTMAPQAGVSFVLMGLAVLARRTPGRERLAQPLAALPVALCYLSVVGLLFDAKVPYFPDATTMALGTSLALLALVFAIVASQPGVGFGARWRSAGPGGRTMRTLLPAIVVLPPLMNLVGKSGETAGAYDEGFGIALESTALFVLLTTGVVLHSRSLDAMEGERALTRRLRHIVENIPEGVCLVDATGRVLHANARLSALLGRGSAEGLTLADWVDPGVRSLFHDFLARASRGPARATLTVRAEGGALRSLRFSATPVADARAPHQEGALLLVIDETSRRIAEGRLRERAHELEHALRDVDDFATLASHELREPLRKIQLLADVAAHGVSETDAPTGRALVRIRHSAAVLQDRLAALLRYSRLAGSAQRVPGVDLAAVVRDAETALAERLHETGSAVLVGALPTVEGDPRLLVDLFTCLFENAIKFRRPDVPLVIRVDSAPRAGGWVEIAVADNGMGIEAEDSDHIFGVFRTLHERDRFPGSGMGLATCRRVAELHGGEISARGTPGEGSVFTLRLPVRAPQAVPPECEPCEA